MAEPHPLRVLIVDDEPLGIERLAELLHARSGEVEVVGRAENGEDAVRAIRELRPDLVFLDIHMPRGSGLDVVRQVGPERMPATIFVTAYDQHALEAFEVAAVDYLVKPYDDERFGQAFLRARRRLRLEGVEQLQQQLLALLQPGTTATPGSSLLSAGGDYLKRIGVQMRGKMRVVPVDQIDHISASGVYAELHSAGSRHLIRETLQALEEQLDPAEFMRIHRSEIVRLDRVEMLLREGQGSCMVQLRDGTRLRVGRSRREELERRLGRR